MDYRDMGAPSGAPSNAGSPRPRRALAVLGLIAIFAVAACGGSSSSPAAPGGGQPGTTTAPGGASLTSGLSANLSSLNSYQFSWTFSGSSTGAGAPASDSGSLSITGTVINKPAPAVSVNDFGINYIVIGQNAWTSVDGNTWMTVDPGTVSLNDLLPTYDYGTWFDTNADNFSAAGNETKNGVACIHYVGNSSLSKLYSSISGVSASFQADLWVAVDGKYPVSGAYGFSASAGGQSGAFYYHFDITHINDAANAVNPPANVVAIPT